MKEYTQIASFDNYLLAHMTLGLLQENEVDCHLKDEHIVTLDPLLNPAVGGIKIFVANDELDRAKALLKEAEAQYLENIACPRCGEHALAAEENTNMPGSALGKLKNMLLYGQTSTYEKLYRCKKCQLAIRDLPAPDYSQDNSTAENEG